MLEFFRNGGFSMFPVLFFGLATLAAAIAYAMRADEKTRHFIDPMYKVVVFSSATGLLTNLGAVFHYLATKNVPANELSTTLAQGLNESLGPAIMGSAFIAVSFLFVAIGLRRADARAAAA